MAKTPSEKQPKNERSRKGHSRRDLQLPAGVQQIFDAAVKEAAGKPLSMAPGSPLGQVIGAFVEHCLKEEMSEHLGYRPHERMTPETPEARPRRANTRNGYGSKQLKTSMGSTAIEVPRDRLGSFAPQLLPKHQPMSAEIEARVIYMYAHGMSTRDIAEQITALYHFAASKDFVSHVVERLDPELTAWRNRALEEIYAIVYIDAVHLKIRHPNGVKSTAVYIVSGYAESGTHEILGVWIAPSEHSAGHGESASFWQSVLIDLLNRGVTTVLMACTDALTGLAEALAAVYPEARQMPCVVHQVRSSLSLSSWTQRKALAGDLKKIYTAATYPLAETALEQLRERYQPSMPRVVAQWEQLLPRLADLWHYSPALRQMVYTTNPQENINRQVRKMTKARGAMPGIDSALRLVTLVLRDVDQKARDKHRVRRDWSRIIQELHIHFPDVLPPDWGHR
jgi:putative transposase